MTRRKDGAIMGRPKGGKNKKYTPEEKKNHIDLFYQSNLPLNRYAHNNGIPEGTIRRWILKYETFGFDGLISQTGKFSRGNPYASLHLKKNLTEVERLQLELAKKEIECERLKKGYSVKGVGRRKEYVIISKKNSR